MRLVIGHGINFTRSTSGTTGATTSTSGSSSGVTTAKLDVSPRIVALNPAVEPVTITVAVPTYSLATSNSLQAVTAIVMPQGSVMPTTAAGWMASNWPMETVSLAPATSTTTATTTLPPTAPVTIPAAAIPASIGIPAAAPVAAAAATIPAAATAAPVTAAASTTNGAATSTSTTASTPTYLPGPAGGNVVLDVANVPAGGMFVQLIEQYDV